MHCTCVCVSAVGGGRLGSWTEACRSACAPLQLGSTGLHTSALRQCLARPGQQCPADLGAHLLRLFAWTAAAAADSASVSRSQSHTAPDSPGDGSPTTTGTLSGSVTPSHPDTEDNSNNSHNSSRSSDADQSHSHSHAATADAVAAAAAPKLVQPTLEQCIELFCEEVRAYTYLDWWRMIFVGVQGLPRVSSAVYVLIL